MRRTNGSRQGIVAAQVILLSLIASFGSVSPGLSRNVDPPPPHKKNADVDPVSLGKVSGGVYDAVTYKPIAGATVSIRAEGHFADKGKTVTTTDEAGYYRCEAEIGRTVRRADPLLIIGGIAMGARLPGTLSATNRMDVDQLTLRISAPGYKPFAGIVRCRNIRPTSFEVEMEPVQLAPEGNPAASIAVPDWGVARIVDLRLEPPIALPGEEVQATLQIACPPPGKALNGKEHPFKAFLHHGEDKMVELKERAAAGDGTYTFRGKFKAPKLDKNSLGNIRPIHVFVESPFTFAKRTINETSRINGAKFCFAEGKDESILLTIPSNALREEATTRLDAYRVCYKGDFADGAARFAALSKSAAGILFDDLMTGQLYMELRQPAVAVEYFKRGFDKSKSGISATLYAEALLMSDQPQRVVDECGHFLTDLKSKKKDSDLPKFLPYEFLVHLGSAYLKVGEVEKARGILDLLHQESASWQDNPIFDASVRFAEADKRLKASPYDSTAIADRVRALRDRGQWQDAVAANEAMPIVYQRNPILMRDSIYCRLHLPAVTLSEAELNAAISAAESLTITKEDGKDVYVKDFLPWHILGILRYGRAEQLRRNGSADLGSAYNSAHEAFDNALRYGRPTPPERPWNAFSYSVFIKGFSSPNASFDFDLRQSLLVLRNQPDDALALTELGQALLDSGMPASADDALARALAVAPDAIEPRFLRAVIAISQGQTDQAITGFQDVIEKAPNHPQARLALAALLAARGDVAGAAAQREAHERLYPTP